MVIYTVLIIRLNQLKNKVFTKHNIRINKPVVNAMKDVLKEITRLRTERGWTEYELAKRSGLEQSTISTWYRKKQIPRLQTLEKVCHGLGVTLSQFFAEGEDSIFLTATQKEMLDHWSALEPKQQQIILDLLKNI